MKTSATLFWSAILGVILSTLLSGCATAPAALPTAQVFNDSLFAPPQERISADDVFALSPEMRQFLNVAIADQLRINGLRQGLFDALYSKQQLKLDYDATFTRNATEAFAARSGNCLSLVIMTGAFAKALGLPVVYQSVIGKESWTRTEGLYFANGHVNLSLGGSPMPNRNAKEGGNAEENFLMTIDFVAPEQMRLQRRRVLTEEAVIAMFMNNRAAENLAAGQLDKAYWWARAAIVQDPKFIAAYNTLAVIYRHHSQPKLAERILANILEVEPANIQAMSNLALTYSDQGRTAEAQALTLKVQQMRAYPPFYFFDQGLASMKAKDYKTAKDLFTKELDRDQYYHEFHAWLAAAYVGLGDLKQGRRQLILAIENSSTPKERELYAAKLEQVDSYPAQ